MMDKKGELTTKKIVIIITLVVSFSIILFFLLRLDLGGTTQEQVCHNSVILKGKAKGLIGKLDCKTEYLCISGGGDCEGSYDKVNVESKEEVFEIIANEMAECWWMFGGEHDVEYAPLIDHAKKVATQKTFHCPICNSIKFKDLGEKVYSSELYDYLAENNYDSRTHLEYLYGVHDRADVEYGVNLDSKMKEKIGEYIQTEYDPFSEVEEYVIVVGRDRNGAKVFQPFLARQSKIHLTPCNVFDITIS